MRQHQRRIIFPLLQKNYRLPPDSGQARQLFLGQTIFSPEFFNAVRHITFDIPRSASEPRDCHVLPTARPGTASYLLR